MFPSRTDCPRRSLPNHCRLLASNEFALTSMGLDAEPARSILGRLAKACNSSGRGLALACNVGRDPARPTSGSVRNGHQNGLVGHHRR